MRNVPARRHRNAGIGDFSRTLFFPPAAVPPPSKPMRLELFEIPKTYPPFLNLPRHPTWLVVIIFHIGFPMSKNNFLVPDLGPHLPFPIH